VFDLYISHRKKIIFVEEPVQMVQWLQIPVNKVRITHVELVVFVNLEAAICAVWWPII